MYYIWYTNGRGGNTTHSRAKPTIVPVLDTSSKNLQEERNISRTMCGDSFRGLSALQLTEPWLCPKYLIEICSCFRGTLYGGGGDSGGRHVAMKALKPGNSSEADAEDLERELQVMQLLQHPHIVRLAGAGPMPEVKNALTAVTVQGRHPAKVLSYAMVQLSLLLQRSASNELCRFWGGGRFLRNARRGDYSSPRSSSREARCPPQ